MRPVSNRIRSRPPRGIVRSPRSLDDPGDIAGYLTDEAHFPGGHCPRVLLPEDEGEVAWSVLHSETVLASGARSSLTGGATPFGETVVSLERIGGVELTGGRLVRAGAGVTLEELQHRLDDDRLWFPPVPTFTGAMVGGAVSTNAAGAATFKYGSTRDWVEGLTLMLASGEVMELRRGEVKADASGRFELEDSAGRLTTVAVPTYEMPDVPKRSAGYHAAAGMDLVDLLVGSEGTLGVVLEASLRVLARDFETLVALVPLSAEAAALELVAELRRESLATRSGRDPGGIDVSAIETMDRRCVEILREDGAGRDCGVPLEAGDDTLVLLQLELPADLSTESLYAQLGSYDEPDAPSTPLVRLCRLLESAGGLERMQVALPGERTRAGQLFRLREAVPVGVNRRVGEAQRREGPAVQKVAADMIVPFERFREMMRLYREGFARHGLDGAIWGHASDGNVHPNVIPSTAADVDAGKRLLLELGREVARLGGCPLSEHGAGRNPVKQELLRQLYGEAGVDQMRAVKRAFDPGWKLAPGVLFPR